MKKIDFFCFWECGKIGINIIDKDDKLVCLDISLEDAKKVLVDLHSAISTYESLERTTEAYFNGEANG